jgi:hypothetical protein
VGVDPSVARYREEYRSVEIGGNYRGWLHFAFTSSVCLVGVVLSALGLEQVSPAEWLTIPVVFIYANLVEYLGHRGPMHHPVSGLGLLYRRHTKQHHRFFTNKEMSFESSRDFKAVLFPPVMILFFIGAMGIPMWVLMYFLTSENVAWLAVATALAYYLNYEWLHFAYHCQPQSRIGRLPGIKVLRQLHLNHHNPRLMTTCNFNITYPVGDWLFRTFYSGR